VIFYCDQLNSFMNDAQYYLKPQGKDSYKLCCGGNNCPQVTRLDSETVEIQDDDGNKVTIKNGQAKLIADAVKSLEDNKNELLLG
jgi:hypothetical protein